MNTDRIAFWDNAKAILIFLVVLGHFLLPVYSERGIAVDVIYTCIYLFHMPAFVYISGYFSKSYVRNGATDIRKIIGFLVLYIIYCLPSLVTTKSITPLLSPNSAQWYLLCMAFWYILIPYCAKIKTIPMMLFSVLLGLLVGLNYSIGSFLSLSRCLVFFPFFLAGYYSEGKGIINAKLHIKIVSWLVLLIALSTTILCHNLLSQHISILYADSGYSSVWGIGERLCWYIFSSILTIAFLCVVPRKQYFFTYIGQRTLAIYILHRPIRGVCRYLGLYNYLDSDIKTISFCIVMSIVLSFVLSEKHITKIFNTAFTSKYKMLVQDISSDF